MHSFVDLMDDIVWTETDIINRTESLIRTKFSQDAENILSRKTSAAMMGQYVLSPQEMQEVQTYSVVCYLAQEAGKKSREDMALKRQVMDYEKAVKIIENQSAYDLSQISWAQDIDQNATPEVISLAGAREQHRNA